jgi:2-hydroxychromene-2-carboxylate isomerase
MAARLDFWFDYTCPYAYIASTQVRKLAQRMGVALVWQPMLLGGVFRANDTPQNLSEVLLPPKLAHNERDFARWAALFGVRLHKPHAHPMRSVEALRATIATGLDPHVIEGFFRAYWVEGRQPSEPATIRDVVQAAGHSPDDVLAQIATDQVKDDLRHRTDRAIALGIFGAPTFIVDEKELYWGQDRMHFVADARVDDVLPAIVRAPHPARSLELFWDFSSPFAYLGASQAEALAARTGATLVWRPMLLGGLFKTIGQANVPLATWSVAKQRYYAKDMDRWAAYYGVPFKWPSHFPMNTIKAMRCQLALEGAPAVAFREATFRAFWAEDRDISDDAVLRELLTGAGADAAAVLARTQTPEIKQALIDATQRAAERGVFGAPTWVVAVAGVVGGEELFWGQDRIPLVERALVSA